LTGNAKHAIPAFFNHNQLFIENVNVYSGHWGDANANYRHHPEPTHSKYVNCRTVWGISRIMFDPAEDLLPGVLGGGANVIPRFITSPEEDEVIVINF